MNSKEGMATYLSRPEENRPVVEARDIYKSFVTDGQRVEVLKGVNLTVSAGDSLAIVGASGVGKSTLLHLLGTLERPDSGSIVYTGLDVAKLSDDDLAAFRNRYIGFVFQFHHLLPEFTAVENVMIPAFIAGLEKKSAYSLAEGILYAVGLQDRLKHKVGSLSGGEQQRVAVARAMVLSPRLFLADEPTGNLDTKTGERVHQTILRLGEKNKMATVIVTHNLYLARSMDRCLTIVDGRLEGFDTGRFS